MCACAIDTTPWLPPLSHMCVPAVGCFCGVAIAMADQLNGGCNDGEPRSYIETRGGGLTIPIGGAETDDLTDVTAMEATVATPLWQ